MYCPKCGNETNKDDSYCKSCGEQVNPKDAPLFDFEPKKTGVQALLLYLAFSIIQILILTFISFVLMGIFEAKGMSITSLEYKESAKKMHLFFNSLSTCVLCVMIMGAKNLFRENKPYLMMILGIICSILYGGVVGFVFPAFMTRFKPIEDDSASATQP